MAVLAGETNDLYKYGIFVNCGCGCGDGVLIRIDDSEKEHDQYALWEFINSDWYRAQYGAFGVLIEKLRRIWRIIRNKEYYYSDIIMSKEDFEKFREYINKVGE